MRINFDIDDLEAFLAVKSTGSFHLAAAKLSISQSAVSRRIQKLEAILDISLFERTTRSVNPTLAAKRLEPRAEAILADARETVRAIRDESVAFAHQRNQVITVATIPTVIPSILPRAIAEFRAQGHASRIRLKDMAANEVSESVAAGEADFGICSMPALDPNLRFEHLFDDAMVVALPTDSLLARYESISWNQLADQQIVMPARNTGNRTLIDDSIARMQTELHWTFETERSTTALSLVSGNCALALLPLSLMRAGTDPNVVWRPLIDPQIARPIGLLSRMTREESDQVRALKQAIRAIENLA